MEATAAPPTMLLAKGEIRPEVFLLFQIPKVDIAVDFPSRRYPMVSAFSQTALVFYSCYAPPPLSPNYVLWKFPSSKLRMLNWDNCDINPKMAASVVTNTVSPLGLTFSFTVVPKTQSLKWNVAAELSILFYIFGIELLQ